MMRPRRRRLGAALAAAAAVAVAGCGGPDVTSARLADAVAGTFAHLYTRQQALLGRAAPPAQASAQCGRSGAGPDAHGAGDDWVCVVLLQLSGPVTQVSYEVNAKADGCFVADGPPNVVGGRTLTTPDGRTVLNPLFSFDGCFDTTSA
ncbi:MAG TPA: hypothetical protein VHE83_17225 [Mycobacteriales bacterium]|nr:hypothetical protein [Mycobacteriales bacterium]